MSSPFFRVLENEVAKAVRSKIAWFGIGACATLCAIVFTVAGQVRPGTATNAWGYMTLSLQLVFTDIGLIFLIVFGAMLIAEETRSGTIRAALAGPVHRSEFYAAKAVTALLYTAALTLVVLVVSAGLAALRFGFGPVADEFGTVYGTGEALGNFLLAFFLSWVPLGAMAMYALLVSTLIENSGAAVAVGIGTVYIIDFTKPLIGIDPYVFTGYIGYPWQVMGQVAQGVSCQWRPDVWGMLAICGAYALVAFAAGLCVFVRRDLNG
jgi:ABC-type transport system involved in multi-copper enzyme maturation permease subunit